MQDARIPLFQELRSAMLDDSRKGQPERQASEPAAMAPQAHELNERMMQVSRLATMGEMAAGIAHEINQPLTAIANYAKACEHFLAAPQPNLEEVRTVLQEIGGEALRAGEVIRRLRRLVGKHESERVASSLNDLIEELRTIILADARMHGTRIRFDLGPDLPLAEVDRVQIQHAIINLLRNAFEALQDRPAGTREVVLSTRLSQEDEIEIDVCDNGPGVSTEMQDHMFEPFCTSKPSGSGLGLPICRTIVQAHGGRVDYLRRQAGGAHFRLQLPVLRSEAA